MFTFFYLKIAERRRKSNNITLSFYEGERLEDESGNSTGSEKLAHDCEISNLNPNVKTYEKKTFKSRPSKTRKKFVPLRPVSGLSEASAASNLRIISTVSIHPTKINEDLPERSKECEALLKENKELKEMISKFTKEAESIQKTMLDWTATFKKFTLLPDNTQERPEAPRLDLSVIEQQQNHQIQTQNEQTPQEMITSPNIQPSSFLGKFVESLSKIIVQEKPNKHRLIRKQPTIMFTGGSSETIQRPVAARIEKQQETSGIDLPADELRVQFPITSLKTFLSFSKDLQTNFNQVLKVLMKKNRTDERQSRETSLTLLVNEILSDDLLKYFVWKDLNPGQQRLKMVDFPEFLKLYLSLAHQFQVKGERSSIINTQAAQLLRHKINAANQKHDIKISTYRHENFGDSKKTDEIISKGTLYEIEKKDLNSDSDVEDITPNPLMIDIDDSDDDSD